jgi:hypothetical protein
MVVAPTRVTPSATPTPPFQPGVTSPVPTRTPTDTATPTITPTPTRTMAPFTPTSTPTPTVQVDATPGAVMPTEPQESCVNNIAIRVVTHRDLYRITELATMPTDLTAVPEVTGRCNPRTDSAPEDLTFVWTLAVDYVPSEYDPAFGPSNTIRYQWPLQTSEGAEVFSPDFGNVVRGGTLTITAQMNIEGVWYSGQTAVTILGTNPSPSAFQSYLASQFPGSYYTLWRIAQAESNLRQFTDDGHPKWSGDGHQGVGIMQITYPSPSDDEIWDWKRNADAGNRVLQAAYATARSWPATVSGSSQLKAALDTYNAAREKEGKPQITRIIVPDFTSGNFQCNLLQRENNAIRLYNGAAGTDNIGLPLHEYKLAFDPGADLLDLIVDEEAGTARAQWVRVDPTERPRGRGTPDYVGRVLSRAPPGACR